MRLMRVAGVAIAGLALPLALAVPASAQESVTFNLGDINDTGATGTATLTPTESGGLLVEINDSGMTPGAPHAQHLHGGTDGTNFACPDQSFDENGDGVVNTIEGLPPYGPVFISLTTEGDTSADSGLALDRFPTADDEGNLSYSREIPAEMVPEGTLENLENLHIVQHGADVNGNDEYDVEALGTSPFAESKGVEGVPEEATIPATCGGPGGEVVSAADDDKDQVENVPEGGVETGDGSTDGSALPVLLALGGLTTVGAATAVATRRTLRRDS